MSESTIRVWLRPVPAPEDSDPLTDLAKHWWVSVGDSTTYRELRRALVDAGEPVDELRYDHSCCWDEALQTVATAMLCPFALYGRERHLEAPDAGGWELACQIEPSPTSGFGVFNVSLPIGVGALLRSWPQLTVGEALATFVMLTFPRAWSGFHCRHLPGTALMRQAAAEAL